MEILEMRGERERGVIIGIIPRQLSELQQEPVIDGAGSVLDNLERLPVTYVHLEEGGFPIVTLHFFQFMDSGTEVSHDHLAAFVFTTVVLRQLRELFEVVVHVSEDVFSCIMEQPCETGVGLVPILGHHAGHQETVLGHAVVEGKGSGVAAQQRKIVCDVSDVQILSTEIQRIDMSTRLIELQHE
jgi:hypothetical protein